MTHSYGRGARLAALGLAAAAVLSLTAPAFGAKGQRRQGSRPRLPTLA